MNVFFTPTEMSPYMKIHDRYKQSELESIFDFTDVLIAPSVWYETFGYTVLEALSYGVPVLISNNVGAKDIIPNGCGIIADNLDSEHLRKIIIELTPDRLAGINRNIIKKACIRTVSEMSMEIIEKCYLC